MIGCMRLRVAVPIAASKTGACIKKNFRRNICVIFGITYGAFNMLRLYFTARDHGINIDLQTCQGSRVSMEGKHGD